ncbi:MAG TPA: hypothetical protein VF762_17420 [Blastocatellia bacterium]|jgi:hypothetical protein
MNKPRSLLLILSTLLSIGVFAQGQDLYPISGGTRTEPDLKNKKLIQIIAEKPDYKLTVGRSLMKRKSARMIGIYVKIENLADKPLSVKTSKFSMTDDEGKGYYGLETEEAIKRFNNTHGITTAIIAGPLMNPAVQARMAEEIRRESLESGDIPPHSFKEGIVFFDAPKKQHYTLMVSLTELWPEPFIFSTERQKEKK